MPTPSINLVRKTLAGCLLACASACAGRHIQLKFPDNPTAAAGPGYVCSTTDESKVKCVDATKVDPSEQNQAGTVFVILPPQCKGLFHQITIEDAGESEPKVHVLCAPEENVIQ